MYKNFAVSIDLCNDIRNSKFSTVTRDIGGNKIDFTVFNNRNLVDLTGNTINIAYKNSNNEVLLQTELYSSDLVNGTFSVIIPEEVLYLSGNILAEVVIYKTGEIVTTQQFEFTVRQGIGDGGGYVPIPDIPKWTDALVDVYQNIDNLQSQLDTAVLASSNATIGVYSHTDTTNTNSYTATISSLTYFTGLKINLTVSKTNTTSATLNLNNLGSKSIKINTPTGKVSLTGGELVGVCQLEYDGTDFILVNGQAPSTTTLTKQASIFTTGTGKNASGQDQVLTGTEGQCKVKITGDTATNVVTNGNFVNGTTGWVVGGSSIVVANKTLAITGNGSVSYPYAYANTKSVLLSGKKYFCKAKARVTNANCTSMTIRFNGTGGGTLTTASTINAPVQNQWYDLSGICTITNQITNLIVLLQHNYADATTANGKVMEVQDVVAIDMGLSPSDLLYSLTTSQLNERYPNYIDGMQGVGSLKVTSVAKNLFDVDDFINKAALSYSTLTKIDKGIKIKSTSAATYRIAYKTYTLKPNTQYTVSAIANRLQGTTGGSLGITDSSGGTSLGTSISGYPTPKIKATTPNDGKIRVYFYATVATSESGEVDYTDIQLEESGSATPYEPHKSSILQVQLPEGVQLHKLPNGVADTVEEINGVDNLVQRNKEYVLQASDIDSLITTGTNIDRVVIGRDAFQGIVSQTSSNITPATYVIPNFTNAKDLTWDDTSKTFLYYDTSLYSVSLNLAVPKGTYANLAAAQTALAGTKIIYQLATPIYTPNGQDGFEVTGNLEAFPNGTIYQEPIEWSPWEALQSAQVENLNTYQTSYDFIYTSVISDLKKITDNGLVADWVNFNQVTNYASVNAISTNGATANQVGVSTSGRIYYTFAKGKYANIDAAKADLAGTPFKYVIADTNISKVPATLDITYNLNEKAELLANSASITKLNKEVATMKDLLDIINVTIFLG